MKKIKKLLRAPRRGHWVGDGFPVRAVFADTAFTREISPFLMFDYGGPHDFTPTEARRGVGPHPHRGFETVTIAFQGEIEHADSVGNKGVIGPGDVQWMTAASGIIH
ncbi:MAG: pirin family protein, partial [Candidatus Nitrotoga sp.]